MKIEALHTFHDPAYAKDWASRFTPTSERTRLFDMISNRIDEHRMEKAFVVELGIGPGYLAHQLLSRFSELSYTGIDFSLPMLAIAQKRLSSFEDRISLKKGDLISGDWVNHLDQQPSVIVSTWTLHDLFSGQNIARVYKHCHQVLNKNGILLNGDFIKPVGTRYAYESGRIEIKQHLDFLSAANFSSCECIACFESDKDNPTTSNNYALIEARV